MPALLAIGFACGGLAVRADDAPSKPVLQSPTDLSWFEGNWDVTYNDGVLGAVVGHARVVATHEIAVRDLGASPEQIELDLVHPQTGATYRLRSFRTDFDGSKLEIEFEGLSPPSGMLVDGMPLPPPVEGAVALTAPISATMQATLDGAETFATVIADEPPAYLGNLSLVIQVPAEGALEQLTGEWRYGIASARDVRHSRAGTVSADARAVTGTETWARPPAVVAAVVALSQPKPPEWRRAAEQADHPLHGQVEAAQARWGKDALGLIWLSIAGQDLPVQPRRHVAFTLGGEKVALTGDYRRNPRYPQAFDMQAVLFDGIDNAPKPVTLNDSPGMWIPDLPGNEPLLIRYVRRTSESEFEPVTTIAPGEIYHVEAIYREPPFGDTQTYATIALPKAPSADATTTATLVGDAPPDGETEGATAAPNEPQLTFAVDRVRSGGADLIYRSGRILLVTPGMPPPDPAAVGGAVEEDTGAMAASALIITAEMGGSLQTAEVDPVAAGGKPVAVATVGEMPPSLWQDALERAARCRAQGSATEVTNYIVTEAVTGGSLRQTIPISREDHAAAILARDEMVRSLDAYVSKLNAPNPVDYAAAPEEVKRQEAAWRKTQDVETMSLIQTVWQGKSHPFFNFPVAGPDGEPDQYTLVAAISWSQFHYRFDENKPAFLAYARRAIAEAKGEMLERAAASLKKTQEAGECDVVELLRRVGVGTKPILQGLIPRLMRPAWPDEPGYPAVVPDREARTAVANIGTLAAAIAAQEDYSKLDTDAVIAALTVPFAAAGAVIGLAAEISQVAEVFIQTSSLVNGLMEAGAIAGTVGSLYDGYSFLRDATAWAEAKQDSEFGLGLSSIAGNEYMWAAEARREEALFGMALGGGMAVGGPMLGKLSDLAADAPIPGLGRRATDMAMRDGVDALPPTERWAFDRLADQARRQAAANGPASLTPDQRAVLILAAAADAGRPTGPVGAVTQPSIAAEPAVAPRPDLAAEQPAATQAADTPPSGEALPPLDIGEAPTGVPPIEPIALPETPRPAAPDLDTAAAPAPPKPATQPSPPAQPASPGLTGSLQNAGQSNAVQPAHTASSEPVAAAAAQPAKPTSEPGPAPTGGSQPAKPDAGGGGTTTLTKPDAVAASTPKPPDQPTTGSTTPTENTAVAANTTPSASQQPSNSPAQPTSPTTASQPAPAKPATTASNTPPAQPVNTAPASQPAPAKPATTASSTPPAQPVNTGTASAAEPVAAGSSSSSNVADAHLGDTDPGALRRPTLDDPNASRTDAGSLRRPTPDANPPADGGRNPNWNDIWDRFDNSDLAKSYDEDTIAFGPNDSYVPPDENVGRGGYVYQPGDAERLGDFLDGVRAIDRDHVGEVVEFWRRMGLEPEAVMAGHSFMRDLDPSATSLPPDEFRQALNRYLRDHEGVADLARREAMIDGYLNRHAGEAQLAALDTTDLPDASGSTTFLPKPDLPDSTAGSSTTLLPKPDLPDSTAGSSTTKLPDPDLPDSTAGSSTTNLPDPDLPGSTAGSSTTKLPDPDLPDSTASSSTTQMSDAEMPSADGGSSSSSHSSGDDGSSSGPSSSSGSSSVRTEMLPPPDLPAADTGALPSEAGTGKFVAGQDDAPHQGGEDFDPVGHFDEGSGNRPSSSDDYDPFKRLDEDLDLAGEADQVIDVADLFPHSNSPGPPLDPLSGPSAASSPSAGPIKLAGDSSSPSSGPFDISVSSFGAPPAMRPYDGDFRLAPNSMHDSGWKPGPEGTWVLGGEKVWPGKQLNPVKQPPDIYAKDGGWAPGERPQGRFADVRAGVDGNVKPVGAVDKTIGEREPWVRVGPDERTGPNDPWWKQEAPIGRERAVQMVKETLHGAAAVENLDIAQLEILAVDLDGPMPRILQRQIGQHLDRVKVKDGSVVEEVWGKDVLNGKRLPPPYDDALAKGMGTLAKHNLTWEDGNLGNIFFQKVRRADGSEYWRMGIADTDRLDFFDTPHRGSELYNWMSAVQTKPELAGVHSRPRDAPLRNAEDAMLAALEHKGHIWWNKAKNCFIAVTVPVSVLIAQFPSFRVCPGQSSALVPSDLDRGVLPIRSWPKLALLEGRAISAAMDAVAWSRLAA